VSPLNLGLRSFLPTSAFLHPSSRASRQERKGRKRAHLSFVRTPITSRRRHGADGCPHFLGQVHRRQSVPGVACRHRAPSGEHRSSTPDVDCAGVGDGAKSSQQLHRQPTRLHERGFGIPAGRFLRALCHHYGVELHNFAPNAISQAAVFIAVCEGYLGFPAHWNLWRHLFQGGLFTESISQGVWRPVRAGGLILLLRESRKDLYIPCIMTTNNCEWDRAWFYLRNDSELLPPYTSKVLVEKPDSWGYGVSPLKRQARLGVYTDAQRRLANKGLTVAIVVANFHRRRVLPLMERRLPLFKMT